jgi:hypothetical protein
MVASRTFGHLLQPGFHQEEFQPLNLEHTQVTRKNRPRTFPSDTLHYSSTEPKDKHTFRLVKEHLSSQVVTEWNQSVDPLAV